MQKNFCEACGAKLQQKESLVWWCETCQTNYYANPKPGAEIVLYREGKILISKRGVEPEKGKFDMPGGFTELHESLEDSLIREAEEELGISSHAYSAPVYVRSYNAPYQYGENLYRVLVVVYAAQLHKEVEPIANDDVASVQWITESEIETTDWANEEQRTTAKMIFEKFIN